MLVIEAIGTPAPKGSKKAFVNPRTGRAIVVDDNAPAKKAWHSTVAAAATEAMKTSGAAPFVGVALSVNVTFYLLRPTGHYSQKAGRSLLPSAPKFPSVKPDLDKLVRSTMDPLEGVVYDGDSRIVRFVATKVYAEIGMSPRAVIAVEPMALPAPPLDELRLL